MIVNSYVDHDARIVWLSNVSRASKLIDREIFDWLGQPLWIACDERDKVRIRAAFAECRLTGVPQSLEVNTQLGAVQERWIVEMERVPDHGIVRSSGRLIPRSPRVLSYREVQIVWLAAHDYDMEKIASKLGVASATISHQMRQIRQKLQVTTNAAVGVYAVISGIYDQPFPENVTMQE